MSEPAFQPPIDFDVLGKSIYAQGAEEAMLARIFERIEPTTRFCVDTGASDGLRNSNTALLLREQGFRGVLVEGSDYRFGRLVEHWGGAPNVRLVHAQVQPADVEAILAAAEVPADVDLLNVDIDGNDYWVWQAIERVRPKVVVVEYNPYYEPPRRWVMTYDPAHAWDGSTYYGASLQSLYHLGQRKGYALIACDRQGNNAFFVADAYYPRFGLADNAPQKLYRPAMYKARFLGSNTFVTGHPYRWGPGEEI